MFAPIPGWPTIMLAAILAPLLLVAAWGDLRRRTIPNPLNAAIALLAPVWWWAGGLPLWPDAALQAGMALLLFALFAALFAAGMMGGGDVKMIAAVALWFTPIESLRVMTITALAGGLLTVMVALDHSVRKRPGMPEIPYGIAIATGGLWNIANHILTTASH